MANPRVFRLTMSLRLGAAVTTIVLVAVNGPYWPSLVLLLVTSYYYAWYRTIGGDGSEEMGLIVVTTAAISSCPFYSDEATLAVALCFLGIQCLFVYFVSGMSKLLSRTWRSGTAIREIMRTEEYGHPFFYRMVNYSSIVARLMTWATVCFEVLLPISVFIWPNAVFAFIGLGLLFHISCAWIMGLNGFPIAFAANYPAIMFLCNRLHCDAVVSS
jgi:hypothetical protein